MYKLFLTPDRQNVAGVIRLSDGAAIPANLDNTDYQEYLKWVSEGGVPLPPDSQE